MRDTPAAIDDVSVELLNDDTTPYDFVVQILQSVFGKDVEQARSLTNAIHNNGVARLGPFAPSIAQSMVDVAAERARVAEVPFTVRLAGAATTSGTIACSFCARAQADCKWMYRGSAGAFVCDACIINSAKAMHLQTPSSVMRNVYEVLDWHFGGIPEAEIVAVERTFPGRMRADLQRALDEVLAQGEVRLVGIHGGTSYEAITFAALFGERRHPKAIGPLQYEEVDIGEDMPMRCLANGLWLLRESNTPVVVLLSRPPRHEGSHLSVTVAAPAGAIGQQFADSLFRSLEKAIADARSYRGKVLSLDQQDHYRGFATGIAVHRLPPITRDEVVLPEATVRLIDRNVVQFARLRPKLVALGQSGRKGLLFHGPPGTGKTHTVRYLAGCLPDHTTLLVTAGQAGLISEYFALARLLQPSILVIEDADLIARNREDMGSACEEVLLNQLLNEMDGLKPDAAIFVVLTTNRPQALEAALAQRPGRVDQAVEFPAPDFANRLKLISLYRGDLDIDSKVSDELARRTDGVSAAFIKELMRRLSQLVIERASGTRVEASDVDAALGELALNNDRLTRTLLGVGAG
ncbi:ATP-dependent Clp protease adaptor ClpS [Dokdonella sp.]|uniref:ATP-dependent Clp protease adaptor ClpS n=1 Tax=Dokdonella sp. TaxID=2291710 RepID=UPI00378329D8